MKVFLIGLWLTAVALGATYGAALMSASASSTETKAEGPPLQREKTRAVNVPIIVEGTVQGFVGMQFVYTIDAAVLKSLAVPPEAYLLDEAFGTVYSDKTIDFRHLERLDLPAFTKGLVDRTNARLGAPMIKDVLIESLSYIPKNTDQE